METLSETAPAAERAKQLGAYYTPPDLLHPLVRWAVRADTGGVLDPSYGDGRFLVSAAHRLTALGVPDAAARLYGSEIEPRPSGDFQRLQVPDGNLVRRDFFACTIDTWGGRRFDAIVGNPPYVRHHLFAPENKLRARRRMKESAVELSERADVWAYFCSYLLGFIAQRGRMALVLPGAVLHADYANPVIDAWVRGDRSVRLVRVRERLFPGVNERTVVLLVDGTQPSGVEYQEVENARELSAILGEDHRASSGWRRGSAPSQDASTSPATRIQSRLRWFVPPGVEDLWNEIGTHHAVTRLGELATIRIGVVSGANRFFVVNRDTASAMLGRGRSNQVRFVDCVSRNSWLREPVWTSEAQELHAHEPSLLMLIKSDGELPKKLQIALEAAEVDGLHERSHCARRDPWYALDDSWAPDLFLPYMTSKGPRLVLNLAGATCTNAVHRVRANDSAQGVAMAAGSWTSLFRLSAELSGRSYGGGVLKVELGEAADIVMPLPEDADSVQSELCSAYASGGVEAAVAVADALVLRQQIGLAKREIRVLRDAVDVLVRRRRK